MLNQNQHIVPGRTHRL